VPQRTDIESYQRNHTYKHNRISAIPWWWRSNSQSTWTEQNLSCRHGTV